MITVTSAAETKLLAHLTTSGMDAIRVGVRGGGCSGFTYYMEAEKLKSESDDREIDINDIKIIIDNKSFLYLMGTEIDYIDSLAGAGFKFNNPSAKRTCGCGESFSI